MTAEDGPGDYPAAIMNRSQARAAIVDLVKKFSAGKAVFKDPKRYNEAQVRKGFIDPLFEALGWPIEKSHQLVGKKREVIVEDRAGTGQNLRPDYGFYSNGELRFYVEAKQPSLNITTDRDAIFQLKSYVWNKRAPLGILTDFEEFLAFHGAYKPDREKPQVAGLKDLYFAYEDYEHRFDVLYDTFSRDAVLGGSIERTVAQAIAANARQSGILERDLFKLRGAIPVDKDFLATLSSWREEIATELARRNRFESGAELTEAVQRIIDRVVFARVAEARSIEHTHTLARAKARWEKDGKKKPLYDYVIDLFGRLALQFNGGLFSPHPLSDKAVFEKNQILVTIIDSLYPPDTDYRFDAMSVEILGAVYEQFLGSVVRIDSRGRAEIEPKPEVRHAGGVYYTPSYIVDTIVEKIVGPLLHGRSPKSALDIRIVDPACGSGSFLLGAYQFLIDWHLEYYAALPDGPRKHPGACYRDEDERLRLTLSLKREILTTCIYGVDIDPQAVEVAQMSLYIKLLEDEAEETIALQKSLQLFKAEKYLPDLSKNIRCGNSLLSRRDLGIAELSPQDEERVNPFDWNAESTGFGAIVRTEARGGRGGFDAVIGNPPYIRVQELAQNPLELAAYRASHPTISEGNADIYVAFVEQGLKLLRGAGRLGFILPTQWWRADYGEALRQLVRKGKHYADTWDFAHEQVFDGATTYTCISTFTKAPSKAVAYRRMSPLAIQRQRDRAPAVWEHSVPWKNLAEGAWYPGVEKSVRSLFDRLRSEGPFLGDPSVCPRVFQGLKTSLDPVYVLDIVGVQGENTRLRSKALDREVLIESAIMKSIVKGKEMKRFSPRPPRKAVLFPYQFEGEEATLIPPGKFKHDYPLAWSYLNENKVALEGRERGRMAGPRWYAYIYPKSMTLFQRQKLLTADLADRASFSFDAKGDYYLLGGAAGGYGLLPARPELAPLILGALNSTLLEWMLRPPGFSSPFRGGWFSCEARFINLLPIRIPTTKADRTKLSDLALRAVDQYARLAEAKIQKQIDAASRQIEEIEAEIDDRVFQLYGVSASERDEVVRIVRRAREETGLSGAAETVDNEE